MFYLLELYHTILMRTKLRGIVITYLFCFEQTQFSRQCILNTMFRELNFLNLKLSEIILLTILYDRLLFSSSRFSYFVGLG